MPQVNKERMMVSLLAVLWAVQAAVIMQQLLIHWHTPVFFKEILLPEGIGRMGPKWDLVIYFIFILVALATGCGTMFFYRKPVTYRLLLWEGSLAFLMASALFKMLVNFDSPQLAERVLMVLIGISVLGKMFFPEFKKTTGVITRPFKGFPWASYADFWWPALIVVLIYMPDLQRVIALIYIGDWMHHMDFFLMSSGWAATCGQVPFVEYGLGLPVIFAKILQAFGNFDYVPALGAMMWFVIIYFILMYFLVRYWLKSALIAGVVFLLVFRLQMFHFGVSPLIWVTPSASPVRFGLDIVWLAALLLHLRTGRWPWLALAAFYSGFSLYYMTSVGMCVTASFYVCLVSLIFFPSLRKTVLPRPIAWYYLCWFLPVVSAILFFGLTLKGLMLEKGYWHNLVDYMRIFEHLGSMPMWESLKYRHFWAFFMSMVMPLTYLTTLLYIGACLYLGKGPVEYVWVAVLCVYGLCNYEYYVVRAAITSYYINALPFVLVVSFWFVRCLDFTSGAWGQRLRMAAMALSFYALFTNQNFLDYPNLLNVSPNPMTDPLVIQRFPDRQGFFNNQYKKLTEDQKVPLNDLGTKEDDMRTEDDFSSDGQLVEYYRRHFDFTKDAALIDRLTPRGEKVALLSSFETKILIQANRPPLFYHFCVLGSRPMTFRSLPSLADAPRTPDFLNDTYKELEEQPQGFVFMEKVFLQGSFPVSFQKNDSMLLDIINYVKAHYQPVAYGQYLVAMKRKIQE